MAEPVYPNGMTREQVLALPVIDNPEWVTWFEDCEAQWCYDSAGAIWHLSQHPDTKQWMRYQ